MQIQQITVAYGGKMNLGDYNSAHIEMSATALLSEGDDPPTSRNELLAFVTAGVQEKARELFARRAAKVDEIFAGLPLEAQQQVKG